MKYQGSCHCGKIKFEIESQIEQVIDCNCSHCSRKGYLLHFIDRKHLTSSTDLNKLPTYKFNHKVIEHKFCDVCGCAPFGFGVNPKTKEATVAVNVRCLENIDLEKLQIKKVDGRSY